MKTLKKLFITIAKIITIFFTILSIVLVIVSLIKPDWIKFGIEWIGELIKTLGNWNYLIAFTSACIESLPIIGTAVPGMNVMILVWGFWWKSHIILTILLASIGAMIGNYLGYWIGKWYGHEIIEKYGEYIVLGKFHNFTRSFVPFIAWASGMWEKNFWSYNIVGSIIWAVSVNLLGIFFIDQYESILDNLGKIMLGILVIVFGYFWFYKKETLKQYIRDKQNEIERKIENQKK